MTMTLEQLHIEVLRNAAPEREQELATIIGAAGAQVSLASDRPGFELMTGFGLIIVGYRTPAATWIISQAAWDCIAAYSPAILNGKLSSVQIATLPGQQESVSKVQRRLEAAHELLGLPDAERFNWPAGVPRPNDDMAEPADQAVRDITHIAWAFMLLHELKHGELEASGKHLEPAIEEERECDAFGISFLLDGVDSYAAAHEKPLNKVRDLRAMGIMTGLFAIAILGQESSSSHPPAQERFRRLFDEVGDQPVKWFWFYAAIVIMGTLEARGRAFTQDLELNHAGLAALVSHL